jgi:hypothetical protein
MQKITFERIRKTYNGRVGCGCGCLGTYTLPSHAFIDEANKQTGYIAYDESSVSDRRAKIAMNKVNAAIEKYGTLAKGPRNGTYEYLSADVWFGYSDVHGYASIDNFTNGRSTTVYF